MEQPRCRKCGNPIAFIKREFNSVLKWMPVNQDGSEHWDVCRGIVRTPEWCKARIAQEHLEYPSGWRGTAKFVYAGNVPPWDQQPDSREQQEHGFAQLALALAVVAQRAATRALEEDEIEVVHYAVEVIAPAPVEPLPAENRIILPGKH